MSNESSKVIKRQWHVLRYLLDGRFVSTSEIRQYLLQTGIDAEMRTIQRDLNMLETVFPLECRRDSIPHSWRWRRIESTVKGLTISQALTLRLIEEQLHDVLPKELLGQLAPLLEKARLLTSVTFPYGVPAQADRKLPELPAHSSKSGSNGFGVVSSSPLDDALAGLGRKIVYLFSDPAKETQKMQDKQIKQAVAEILVVLNSAQLPELAAELKRLYI